MKKVGQTCSLACYAHMVAMIGIDSRVKDRPMSLEEQEWYRDEQDKIDRIADLHE